MTKAQANKILDFIRHHFDSVGQVEYFDLCDLLFEVIEHDANVGRYAAALAKDNPDFFEMK